MKKDIYTMTNKECLECLTFIITQEKFANDYINQLK